MSMDRAVSYFVAPPDGTGELKWLADLLGEDAGILLGLQCAIADINGDDGSGNLPMPNGMLDAFELGLIEKVLNNPGQYSSPGSWTTQLASQMQYNYQQIWTAGMNNLVFSQLPMLWGMLQSILAGEGITVPPYAECSTAINTLFPDLMKLLAEYGLVGDTATLGAIQEVGGLLALCDILAQGSCLVTDLTAGNIAGFPTKLAPAGDADGDGVTNETEYDNVMAQQKAAPAGVSCYTDAALNPALNGTEECGAAPPCAASSVPSIVTIAAGQAIDITGNASCLQGTTITWTWTHSVKGVIGGTGSRLLIQNVDTSYNGTITGTADDGTKATAVTPAIPITVYASAPLAGGLGLGLLASVCALGGALSIRRKR